MRAISADHSWQAIKQKLAPRHIANPIGTQVLVSECQPQNSHNTANGSFGSAIAFWSVDDRTVLDNSKPVAKALEEFRGDEVILVTQISSGIPVRQTQCRRNKSATFPAVNPFFAQGIAWM